VSSMLPEYAVGIRSYGRTIAQDAFGQPRCFANAIHGARIGAWVYRAGKKITIWERITP